MARSIWSGAISFGLVSVPVKLFSATESHRVHFHQLQRGTGERIQHRRVAEASGEEVDYDDIVKGYEVERGRHVVIEREELEQLEPQQTRTIEIEDFIELADIDAMYFDTSYYLAPADEAAAKPYELLRTTMDECERVGIARFVMRTKQHLAAVRPLGPGLVLETMFFADEVRDPAQIEEMRHLDDVELTERERATATQLIESLSTTWDPSAYEDTYHQQVMELIERKARGEDLVVEDEPEPAPVLDLMKALEASVEKARGSRRSRGDGSGERSMDELYEEAQRKDIAGRSKMNKQELIDALQQAS